MAISRMMNTNRTTQLFESEYNKLNELQKQAVEHIEGPLLVIAGPGTGKTQILAIRIGNILLKTDANPGNILCLTYTESGAANMRKRLIQFIGPTAYEITISTFHAFCNSVIKENPDSFAHYSDYEVVSELERVTVFQKILKALDRTNVLYNVRDEYHNEFGRLIALFEKIKKEHWDPNTLLIDIDQWVMQQRQSEDYIYKRTSKNGKPGDFNEAKFNKEILNPAKRSIAAVNLFKQYQEELNQLHRFEYEDMIQWVIRQFEQDDALLQKYQEKFQYILVDEYQDTNGAQNKILFHLLNYHDSPNIFAVGDDDQAIFRFQGANVQNMFDFELLYNPLKIRLSTNYRSSQIILDVANRMIVNNKERLAAKYNEEAISLKAGGDFAFAALRPIVTKYTEQKSEVWDVCQQIRTLLDNGVDPHKIAILYRKNKEADPYIKCFAGLQIPYQITKQINLLDDPFVKQLFLLLEFFAAPDTELYQQDHLLYKVLHAPFIDIDTNDIGKIAFKQQSMRYEARDKNPYGDSNITSPEHSLLNLLSDKEFLKDLDIQKFQSCMALHETLTLLYKQINDFTPQVFLEKLLNDLKVLPFILGLDDKFHYLQVINSLFEFVKSESDKNPQLTVLDLIRILKEYQENKLVIPHNILSGSLKGIVLSTLHSAKGQEYDYVFMINNTHANWTSNKQVNFKLPDGYINNNISSEEDLRRLFYVGVTRARLGLYLSYSTAGQKSDMVPCRFVEEMKASDQMDERIHLANEMELMDQMVVDLSPLVKNFIVLEQNQFDQFIANFKLNPTALNKYLECPVAFYYENVLRIPGARTPHLGYGNAVHYAMERFMKDKCLQKSNFAEKLVQYFHNGMFKYHSHFTQREFENYLSEGERVLVPFINCFREEWKEVMDTQEEVKISTECRGIPITGKLDRIDILKQGIRVIDYKTGKPDQKKITTPNDKLPYGSPYWQQMVFYAVLLKQHSIYKNAKVISSLYFVTPNKDVRFEKVELEPENYIEFLENTIEITYQKIKNKEFTPGCGKENCSWCGYVNAGNVVSMLEETEDDESY